MSQGPPCVWALLGKRPGDNAQIEILAAASGLSVTVKPLRFRKALETLPNLRRDGSLFSLTADTQAMLAERPAPDIVVAAGKRSAAAALRIKATTGARLVHLGRTWAPGAWFDLVITTPQYSQPAGSNVVINRFPLTAAVDPPSRLAEDVAALPRPRLLVAFGGDAAGLRLDAAAARALIGRATARQRAEGGSLMVATSPRTSPDAVAALREALAPSATRLLCVFGEGPNRYRDFLAAADGAIVTEDSVSMVAEAAASGAPVEIFRLPPRPEGAAYLRRALRVVGLEARAAALGLVDSGRAISGYMTALEADGWLDGARAPERMAAELSAAAALVRELAAGGRHDAGAPQARRVAPRRPPDLAVESPTTAARPRAGDVT